MLLGPVRRGRAAPAVSRGAERVTVSVVYLALAAVMLARNRRELVPLTRAGLKAPYERLLAHG